MEWRHLITDYGMRADSFSAYVSEADPKVTGQDDAPEVPGCCDNCGAATLHYWAVDPDDSYSPHASACLTCGAFYRYNHGREGDPIPPEVGWQVECWHHTSPDDMRGTCWHVHTYPAYAAALESLQEDEAPDLIVLGYWWVDSYGVGGDVWRGTGGERVYLILSPVGGAK